MSDTHPPTPPAANPRPATPRAAGPRKSPPREAKRSGCGCPAGCLIAVAVVAVLVVGGAGAGYLWGRPYIARQLPAWEAQVPLLGPALDITGLRARLVPPVDTERLQRGRQEGENNPHGLPADLTVYPNPVAETYNVSPTQVTAYQRVAEPLETVRAHLAEGMTRDGWTLAQEREIQDGVQLGWVKEGRACQMELGAYGRYTEVWLRGSGS